MEERQIELRAELDAIRPLGDAVTNFCAMHGLPARVSDQLCLVLEELLTNLVRHGIDGVPPPDPPGHHKAVVHLTYGGNEIVAVFEDSGRAFDPLDLPEPDFDAGVEDRPIGGLGIYLVRTLMDSVTYSRADGCNRLTMVKAIG